MKIEIEGTPAHLAAIKAALEMYFRVALGQFDAIRVEHEDRLYKNYEAPGRDGNWPDYPLLLNRAIKPILQPDLADSPNASYSIGNPLTGKRAQCCYEVWKLLRGEKPVKYSGEPLPDVWVS